MPAGKSRTLPIILSWYYPNRDIADERVGNFYTTLFKSSEDVATHVASHLTEQVQDIVNYQSSISPSKSLFAKVIILEEFACLESFFLYTFCCSF